MYCVFEVLYNSFAYYKIANSKIIILFTELSNCKHNIKPSII